MGIRDDVESRGKNQVGKAGGGSGRSQKGRRCQLTYTPNIYLHHPDGREAWS